MTLPTTMIDPETGVEIPLLPVEAAGEWLRAYLAERPQGVWKATAVAAANEAGITERLLRRASQKIGVRRRGGGRSGVIWMSPEEGVR